MLLLLFGETKFGVQHVLWAYEMAERRGEGGAHCDLRSISWACLAVEKNWRVCVHGVEGRREKSENS